jgi:hypothetical protein
MSKWPMRGQFRHLNFKTFPMTPKTPQCEVFWPFNSSSEFSKVPKDSKFPLLGVWASPSHLAQSGVATMGVQKKIITFMISFFEHRTYLLWWITKHAHYMCMINLTFYDIELEINVVVKWKFSNFIWYMSAELKYTNGKAIKVVR